MQNIGPLLYRTVGGERGGGQRDHAPPPPLTDQRGGGDYVNYINTCTPPHWIFRSSYGSSTSTYSCCDSLVYFCARNVSVDFDWLSGHHTSEVVSKPLDHLSKWINHLWDFIAKFTFPSPDYSNPRVLVIFDHLVSKPSSHNCLIKNKHAKIYKQFYNKKGHALSSTSKSCKNSVSSFLSYGNVHCP